MVDYFLGISSVKAAPTTKLNEIVHDADKDPNFAFVSAVSITPISL